jgi:arylsulfatase A-like enzyme
MNKLSQRTMGYARYLILIGIFFLHVSCRKQTTPPPNIIYIYTDQQSETMMSCSGNEYLKTPAMDYIANNGIRFTRAYATNPVCAPARVSMMTGRFPGYFNDEDGKIVRENGGAQNMPEVSEEVKATTIAAYLKKAGYDLVYGGKEHLPPSLTPGALGFTDITDDERDVLSEKAAQYIKGEHNNPYFMVVSLINPHDICYMGTSDFANAKTLAYLRKNVKIEMETLDKALQLPEGVSKEQFFAEYCPPLPPNFEPQEDESLAIASLLDRRQFRRRAREEYTEEQWRMHRWAYVQLTEMVDAQIQVILDALKESGQEENTLVIFSSDHGDMDASHKMEHKTALYEESANIPFAAMWKGHIPAGQVNNRSLVSNGLDLLPTVCDYAGIKAEADPRGRSLRPLFGGKDTDWRKTLGVESEIGRMVVDEEGYKYIKYDAVGVEEQLMDLNKDPFETIHFTNNKTHSEILSKLRKSFEDEWFPNL